jgi:multidrug efflux pump subunit AcrA (membrane-fusion protein)
VQQMTAQLSGASLQAPVTAAQASNTVVTAQQQLASARNAVQTAQAAYDSAKSTYDADVQLIKSGYVARTQYDQARASYIQAQQSLNTSRETERQAVVALRAAQSQGSNAVPIQAQTIAATRGQLAAARAQVKLLQAQIAQTSINAPFDGIVTQRLLDPGAFASPNQPVARVSQVDTVYINVNVPDDNLGFVRTGTPVSFTCSSIPNRTFTGKVMDVNATPTTGTLSYRARIRVPNPGDVLRGGMLVSVNVRKEFHPNAIVVPRTAVFQTEAGANVFTVVPPQAPPGGAPGGGGAQGGGGALGGAAKGGPGGAAAAGPKIMQAKVVPVQLGLQTDTLAEVRSPAISSGTTVITTRPDALQDKSVVAIGPPAGGGPRGGGQ